MNDVKLIKTAGLKSLKLKELRQDPRYGEVIGAFKAEGLLEAPGLVARKRKCRLEDVLWVGENIEPRLLELLPAVLLKRPGIVFYSQMDGDLKSALQKIRSRNSNFQYKGIAGDKIMQWVPLVGRKGKWPAQTKIFRLDQKYWNALEHIANQQKKSEAEVLRNAIKAYAASANVLVE